jgi:hypothetical protein
MKLVTPDAIEQALVQAEEHALLGAQSIARQRQIIAELDRDGHDSMPARQLLDTMLATQELHERDAAQLRALLRQVGAERGKNPR